MHPPRALDGLNPAELAACVSVLSFESRKQQDNAEPARLPKGPVRDVLTEMGRTWAELDQLERRNGVSFLREPDSGFVWAAYRWVRGVKLEDVLDSVPGLTPGDFVRSVKQLIDLLDQIAAAASYDAKGNAAANAKARSVTPEDPALSQPLAAEDAAANAKARSVPPEDLIFPCLRGPKTEQPGRRHGPLLPRILLFPCRRRPNAVAKAKAPTFPWPPGRDADGRADAAILRRPPRPGLTRCPAVSPPRASAMSRPPPGCDRRDAPRRHRLHQRGGLTGYSEVPS